MLNRIFLPVAVILAAVATPNSNPTAQTAPKLDYEFFKVRVEPIFLTKRPGYARCYVCHAESNNAFHLEKLAPDAHAWSEEQSRLNFAMAAKLVNSGDPDTSRLLLHPLAAEGGGDVFHSGGRQFLSKQDPDWRTLAAWVNGATLSGTRHYVEPLTSPVVPCTRIYGSRITVDSPGRKVALRRGSEPR
jgi:hypothetical protein